MTVADVLHSTFDSEPDTKLRPRHQLKAVEFLEASAKEDPNAGGTFHQLAIAQAGLREIPKAVLSARAAVEKQPLEVRSWHLLGLLLTAQGDWDGAKAVFQFGQENSDLGMDDGTDTADGEPDGSGAGGQDPADSPVVRDFASSTLPVNGSTEPVARKRLSHNQPSALNVADRPRSFSGPLLSPTLDLPPSHTLQIPSPDTPRQNYSDRFEAELLLRMSQLALTEKVEGAEGANLQWPEVFMFFSERCPSAAMSAPSMHISINGQPSVMETGTVGGTRAGSIGTLNCVPL